MSKAEVKRSLQRKLAVRLLQAIAVFIVGIYVILRVIITPAFDELELSRAETDLVRAERSIQNDIENLEAITLDWGPWDDIYGYVSERNPAFQKSNLNRLTLTNLGLDMLAVYELGSELKWAQLLVDGEERPLANLSILGTDDPGSQRMTRHDDAGSSTVGIVQTALGPLLISSQPILRSDDSGPVAGAVVMGQFLNEPRLARLRERTEVDMSWLNLEEFLADDEREPSDIESGMLPVKISDATITNCLVLADIFGTPLLVLSAKTPRNISDLGRQTVNTALFFLAIAGILLMFVMWSHMKGTVIRPIGRLTRHMDKIRESGDLSDKLSMQTNDEIGLLARQYDSLTTEVYDTRAALLHQSFKAGKADTAAEVLHNIRNAMTPMINGMDRLSKAFKVAESLHVSEAVEHLSDPDCPPERVGKYVQYVGASFDRVKSVNAEATEDLNVVISQARQVEAIMSDQEKFTNVAKIAEILVIDEVVEEAAHVIPKESFTDIEVDVDEDLTRYRVRAHRVGLLQVLSNLILNAHESIERAKASDGRISLSASDTVVNNQQMVQLTVRDNGTGFDEEVRNKIFQRGFTSKSKGNTTGLGLHWCANAVAGMGGRIFADSRGSGKGAEFHVLLPAVQGA